MYKELQVYMTCGIRLANNWGTDLADADKNIKIREAGIGANFAKN